MRDVDVNPQGHPSSNVKVAIESPYAVSYLTSIESNIVSSAGEYLRYKYLDTYLRYIKSIFYLVSKYIFVQVSSISI